MCINFGGNLILYLQKIIYLKNLYIAIPYSNTYMYVPLSLLEDWMLVSCDIPVIIYTAINNLLV